VTRDDSHRKLTVEVDPKEPLKTNLAEAVLNAYKDGVADAFRRWLNALVEDLETGRAWCDILGEVFETREQAEKALLERTFGKEAKP